MSINTELSFYDNSGKIVIQYSGQNPEGQKTALSELNWVEGLYPSDEYYISEGVPTLRPAHGITADKTTILADEVDAVTFSGIPANSTLTAKNTVTGDTVTAPCSGTETFTCTIIGLIKIEITNFPYLPYEVLINVN